MDVVVEGQSNVQPSLYTMNTSSAAEGSDASTLPSMFTIKVQIVRNHARKGLYGASHLW